MKYMIYCTAALIICLIAAFIIAKVVLKHLKRKTRKIETILTTTVITTPGWLEGIPWEE